MIRFVAPRQGVNFEQVQSGPKLHADMLNCKNIQAGKKYPTHLSKGIICRKMYELTPRADQSRAGLYTHSALQSDSRYLFE